MCGLFGYVTIDSPDKRDKQWHEFVDNMADAMSYRGTDSYGYAGMWKTNLHYARGLGDISKQYVPSHMDKLIGHTRLATTGDVTIANAHPFQFGDICIAHNGVISNHRSLEQKDEYDYPVDSMALCRRVAMKNPTNDVHGYGALLWINSRTGTFFLSRMVSGDLRAGYVKTAAGGRYFVVASTFAYVADVPGVELKLLSELKQNAIYYIDDKGNMRRASRKIQITPHYRNWRSGRGQYSTSTGYSTKQLTSGSSHYKGDWDEDDLYVYNPNDNGVHTCSASSYISGDAAVHTRFKCTVCDFSTLLIPSEHWISCKFRAFWERPERDDTWEDVESALLSGEGWADPDTEPVVVEETVSEYGECRTCGDRLRTYQADKRGTCYTCYLIHEAETRSPNVDDSDKTV